jgi:hypothetical protein
MAKKQTRKTISISREAYVALKARCEADGTNMSNVVETYVRELVGLPERPTFAPVSGSSGESAARFLEAYRKRTGVALEQACRTCGTTGHNARTCPDKRAAVDASTPPPAAPAIPVKLAAPSNAQIAARLAELERRALDNPCRDPKCHIVSLHLAHSSMP